MEPSLQLPQSISYCGSRWSLAGNYHRIRATRSSSGLPFSSCHLPTQSACISWWPAYALICSWAPHTPASAQSSLWSWPVDKRKESMKHKITNNTSWEQVSNLLLDWMLPFSWRWAWSGHHIRTAFCRISSYLEEGEDALGHWAASPFVIYILQLLIRMQKQGNSSHHYRLNT